ncbi:MAG: carbamoyltransferase C-terminal domain-containing protein [Candidatus Wallbacteria bacterium]|nr:carbamoyltransferase C-terminal domain-containing protein [Candidatus Wallbacteria bacterium]
MAQHDMTGGVILGISAYHEDAAAALVVDGKLVCALEEERIRRIKHWAGFPSEAVKWCLRYACIGLGDIDCVAVARDPRAHFLGKIRAVCSGGAGFGFLKDRLRNTAQVCDVRKELSRCAEEGKKALKAELCPVEHHRAHMASAFYYSPFREAAVASIGGFGDFLSTMQGHGSGNRISILNQVAYPYSLGVFYSAFTEYLGFDKYGDEYKVMGLSASGRPEYLGRMMEIIRLDSNGLYRTDTSFFDFHRIGRDRTESSLPPGLTGCFTEKLTSEFGPPRKIDEPLTVRHRNIAASVQAAFEETLFHILNHLCRKTGSRNLAFAGGCAQNSLANGKLTRMTPFERVFIPPAAHDAGTAIGAALTVWHKKYNRTERIQNCSPFLGPEFSDDEIFAAALSRGLKAEKLPLEQLVEKTAQDLNQGLIVGWFQGRTEWGPRALGNRSILSSPCFPGIRDRLNTAIKKREDFRPFAASVLEEFASDLFDDPQESPFMEKVVRVRQDRAGLIPAVVHVDGTCRIQTVSSADNPGFFQLISAFHRVSGIPALLNTSFNEHEPIVNTPGEALECFARSGMDALAAGSYYIRRAGPT